MLFQKNQFLSSARLAAALSAAALLTAALLTTALSAATLLTAALLTATLFFALAALSLAILLSALLSSAGRSLLVWILLCVHDAFLCYELGVWVVRTRRLTRFQSNRHGKGFGLKHTIGFSGWLALSGKILSGMRSRDPSERSAIVCG